MSLGFAVNGLVSRAAALRKSGLRPGDALILTKPLGTGTLLAADMRGKARARWVMAAYAHMIQSSRRAAEVFREHGVHAATDVTGFGLIGHLLKWCASNVDVTLAIERIPLLAGARETLEMASSSLQPKNVRLRRAIRDLSWRQGTRSISLFDPQTAGGWPPCRSPCRACVDALVAADIQATAGIVEDRSAGLNRLRSTSTARSSRRLAAIAL